MLTKLTFNFGIGFFNNQSLSLEIWCGQNLIHQVDNFVENSYSISVDIDLPNNIIFVVNNRKDHETEMDSNGNLIQDKHIHFQSLEIFDTVVETYQIPESIFEYRDQSNQKITPAFYWNKNGKANLTIDNQDPLVWLLTHHELW